MRAASAVALTGAAAGSAGAAARMIMVVSLTRGGAVARSGGVGARRAEAAEVDGDQVARAVAGGGRLVGVGCARLGGGRFAGGGGGLGGLAPADARLGVAGGGQLGVLALADAGLGFAVGEDLAEVAAHGV